MPPAADGIRADPLQPAGRKALELTFREALRLGHNYIGTEHILLALLDLEAGSGRAGRSRHRQARAEADIRVFLSSGPQGALTSFPISPSSEVVVRRSGEGLPPQGAGEHHRARRAAERRQAVDHRFEVGHRGGDDPQIEHESPVTRSIPTISGQSQTAGSRSTHRLPWQDMRTRAWIVQPSRDGSTWAW